MASYHLAAIFLVILSVLFFANGLDEEQQDNENSTAPALLNYNVIVQRSPDAAERDLMCSGALISYRKVITVAHCFFNSSYYVLSKDNFAVILGDLGTKHTTNSFVIRIADIIIHPDFNTNARERNDLAIVVLDRKIPNNSTDIAPIGLATYGIPDGAKCSISTWIYLFKSWSLSEALQEISVTVLDREACKSTGSKQTICMYGNETILEGTYFLSGSPLVCNGILAGISSRTIRNYLPISTENFTNINHYWRWISENGAQGSTFRKVLLFIVACNIFGLIINVSIF